MAAQLKKTRSRTNRSSLEHEIFELERARELLVERIGEPSQRRKMTAPISMEPSGGENERPFGTGLEYRAKRRPRRFESPLLHQEFAQTDVTSQSQK
jgi:hypothetical protein